MEKKRSFNYFESIIRKSLIYIYIYMLYICLKIDER